MEKILSMLLDNGNFIAVLIILLYREYSHMKREEQLLDRLFSKSLYQYKMVSNETIKKRSEGSKVHTMNDEEMALMEATRSEGA